MMSEHHLQDEILISARKQVCGRWSSESGTLSIFALFCLFPFYHLSLSLFHGLKPVRKQQQSPAAVWRELHKCASTRMGRWRATVMMRRSQHQGVVSHPPPISRPTTMAPLFQAQTFPWHADWSISSWSETCISGHIPQQEGWYWKTWGICHVSPISIPNRWATVTNSLVDSPPENCKDLASNAQKHPCFKLFLGIMSFHMENMLEI